MKRKYVYDGPERIVAEDKAQEIGEAIESLAKSKGGTFKPKDLVEAGRKKGSLLHDFFEWQDSVAAQKWRNEQAKHLLRVLKVRVDVDGEERLERAFICVDVVEGSHAPKKVFVKVDHDRPRHGENVTTKKVDEVTTEWLQLQTRSWLRQNARPIEGPLAGYIITETQANDLARLILTALGIPVVDKKTMRDFADEGAEAS